MPNIKEYNKESLLKFEKEYVGLYLSGHPLDDYLEKYDSFNFTSDMIAGMGEDEMENDGDEMAPSVDFSNNFQEEDPDGLIEVSDEPQVHDGMSVTGGGVITAIKKIMTKTGNMAFLTIEDIYGNYDVMLFSKNYAKFKDIVVEDNLITVRGRLSIRDGKSPVVVADTIIPWEKKSEEVVQEKKIYLRFDTGDIDTYNKVKTIASSYPGKNQIVIKCTSTGKVFSFNAKIDINNYVENELVGLLGEKNVVIVDK